MLRLPGLGQLVLAIWKSPLMLMELMASAAPPVFVIKNCCADVVAPIFVEPNDNEVGLKVEIGARPEPDKLTVCVLAGLPPELSWNVRVADSELPVDALNVMLTTHAVPKFKVAPQVFPEIGKSLMLP